MKFNYDFILTADSEDADMKQCPDGSYVLEDNLAANECGMSCQNHFQIEQNVCFLSRGFSNYGSGVGNSFV